MNLKSFINNIGSPGRMNPASNFQETRDQIVAMCIFKPEDLALDWDASFTWPTGYVKIGTSLAATGTVPATGASIVDIMRALTFGSKAWFFPHGTMKGSKAIGTPTKQAEVYGVFPMAKDTGVITENAELRIAGMHLNMEFWNNMRLVPDGYSVILFLTNMAIWIRPEHTPMFHDIGNAIGGDSANSITGGTAQLGWQGQGEIVWKEGVPFAHLAEGNFKFTFDVPTTVTLTAVPCTSGNIKLTGTSAAGGSYTRPIKEAAFAACVTYSLDIISGPGSAGISINPDTGAVTVTATVAVAGTYKIRVIAQNTTSAYGFYDLILTLA